MNRITRFIGRVLSRGVRPAFFMGILSLALPAMASTFMVALAAYVAIEGLRELSVSITRRLSEAGVKIPGNLFGTIERNLENDNPLGRRMQKEQADRNAKKYLVKNDEGKTVVNNSELPDGMKSLGRLGNMEKHYRISVDGIDSVVYNSDTKEFTFSSVNPEMDTIYYQYLREHDDGKSIPFMKIEDFSIGSRTDIKISSYDPKALVDFIRTASVSRESQVERSVVTTRRYLVHGCTSFEQAKALVAEGRGVQTNVFRDVTVSVDGREFSCSKESYAPTGQLPIGDFYVDVPSTETFSATVRVSAEAARGTSLDALAVDRFDALDTEQYKRVAAAGEPCSPDLGEVTRGVRMGEEFVEILGEASEMRSTLSACIILQFDDEKSLTEFMNSDEPLKGCRVLVDATPDQDGKYTVTVPVTPELISDMEIDRARVDDLLGRNRDFGLTRAEAERIVLEDQIRHGDHMAVRMREAVSLEDARINGVHLNDFMDRLEARDPSLAPFRSDKERRSWMDDAARISDARVDVDPKTRTLRLDCSFVDKDGRKTDRTLTRSLTNSQINALASRDITRAAVMDTVMKIFPHSFGTYAGKDGKALFTDPLLSLIDGRAPKRVQSKNAATKSQKSTVKI